MPATAILTIGTDTEPASFPRSIRLAMNNSRFKTVLFLVFPTKIPKYIIPYDSFFNFSPAKSAITNLISRKSQLCFELMHANDINLLIYKLN